MKSILRWGCVLTVVVVLAAYCGLHHGRDRTDGNPRRVPSAACPPHQDARMSTDQPLTPYPAAATSGDFVQGATVDLAGVGPAELPGLLRTMRDRHHINTISVYGLERWDPTGRTGERDRLFAELERLDLRIVVRLEAYDAARFAFRPADLDFVFAAHAPLLRYLAGERRRDRVAYLSLNMPLDDPGVQRRLGGVDSDLSVRRQPAYAAAFVQRARGALATNGMAGTPVYLGLFYGWDNGYHPPSYAAAGADGYVLTNYSYPAAGVPGAAADDRTLINEPRLRVAVDRAVAQYGDRTPLVVEYGFHTAAAHRGGPPDQRAGLVADVPAKRRALRATHRLYCDNYPSVRGTVYFGFNVFTVEGDPPARLDFALHTAPPAGVGAPSRPGP